MKSFSHLHDYLSHNAERFGAKLALVTDERSFSWAELNQAAEALAATLAPRLTADHQQLVSLLLPNSWQFVVSYLAILKTGHIAAPLDASFKRPQLEAVLAALPPEVVITDRERAPLLSHVAPPLLIFEEIESEPPSSTKYQPVRLPAAEQIATLAFTSGTTGKPKAAPYTHANHLWNIELSTQLWQWTSDDTLMIAMPLSHWHGLVMGLGGFLRHGNTLYLRPWFEPEDALTLLASGKISIFQHVSLAYVRMATHRPEKRYDLSAVRLCTSASAALPPASWKQFKQRFGIEVLECYGSAEAGRIASNTLTERLPGTPGRVIPGVTLKLGPEGEVLVKTPGLFPGYYNNPIATAASMTDGWWVMGDIGTLDADQRLHIKGRVQEKIKKKGYTIYPRDVEWAVAQCPGVTEAYVMGMYDQGKPSDRIAYFIVGSITPPELISYCKDHLPASWRPDTIIVVEAIPRTRTGKPRLAELRAQLPASSA